MKKSPLPPFSKKGGDRIPALVDRGAIKVSLGFGEHLSQTCTYNPNFSILLRRVFRLMPSTLDALT